VENQQSESLVLLVHEMRTPLTVIAGYAADLQARWDTLTDAEKLEAVDAIARNAHQLRRLVDDGVDGSRQLRCETSNFDLAALVRGVVRDFVHLHGDAEFVATIDGRVGRVQGDEGRNRQVLVNLLANAVKFSSGQPRVEIRVSRARRMARVEVRDSGIGIARTERREIFRKFSRSPRVREFGIDGAGVGLYLVKRLVEDQGGRVWVEPRRGGGTTVAYTMPLVAEPVAVGEGDGFGAAVRADLAKDVLDVRGDGLGGDDQLSGDGRLGVPGGQ